MEMGVDDAGDGVFEFWWAWAIEYDVDATAGADTAKVSNVGDEEPEDDDEERGEGEYDWEKGNDAKIHDQFWEIKNEKWHTAKYA